VKFLPLEYEKSLYLLLQKKEKKIFMAINSVNIFVRRGDVRFSNGGYCIKKKKSMAVAIFNRVSGELGIHNLPAKKNLNGRQLEEIEAYGKQISAPIRKGEAFREEETQKTKGACFCKLVTNFSCCKKYCFHK